MNVQQSWYGIATSVPNQTNTSQSAVFPALGGGGGGGGGVTSIEPGIPTGCGIDFNGKTGDVTMQLSLVGGNNITLDPSTSDNSITINSSGPIVKFGSVLMPANDTPVVVELSTPYYINTNSFATTATYKDLNATASDFQISVTQTSVSTITIYGQANFDVGWITAGM